MFENVMEIVVLETVFYTCGWCREVWIIEGYYNAVVYILFIINLLLTMFYSNYATQAVLLTKKYFILIQSILKLYDSTHIVF